jgi:peptidoglycan/LPS O-acetylase OafA/YrhL/thiol-disulfide isomerase/thioredoxin
MRMSVATIITEPSQPHVASVNDAAMPVDAPPRMIQLDALRALAIFAVMACHFFAYRITSEGAQGVTLFFVLSGFLITGILLKCRTYVDRDGQSVLFTLRQFYARRFLRIFPVYYLALALLWIMHDKGVRAELGWHLAYLTNIRMAMNARVHYFPHWSIEHFWSLAVEEQFYLVWPCVVLLVSRRTLLWTVCAMVCAGPALRFAALGLHQHQSIIVTLPFFWLDALGLGSLLAVASDPEFAMSHLLPLARKAALLAGLAAIGFAFYLEHLHRHFSLMYAVYYLGYALVFVWLVSRAAEGFAGIMGRVMSFKPLLWIGTISYGIYVFHYILRVYTIHGLKPIHSQLLYAAVLAVASIALAACSFYFFEAPINRLKRHFSYRAARGTASLSEVIFNWVGPEERKMNYRSLRKIALCASLLATGSTACSAVEKPAAVDPPATAAQSEKARRGMPEIMQDLRNEGDSLSQVLSSPKTLADEARRKEAATTAIPTLKKMAGYLDEMKQTGDLHGKQVADRIGPQVATFLAVFGDKDTTDLLEKQAKSNDPKEAAVATGALLMTHWIHSAQDAKGQEKLLTKAEALARDNSRDENVTQTLVAMAQIGSASPDLLAKVQKLASGMDTQAASQLKEQVAHDENMKSLENKPLTVEGVRLDGSHFSTADWKGKVIFVDFWATWCPTCRAELPRVKKAYADFHDKGLEVLGVSCDNEGAELTRFLEENKDMPWPELFDVKNPGWHPLAKSYGINIMPTMFLIDKKGVLRSVTAREDFEEMIPKLLEEKVE